MKIKICFSVLAGACLLGVCMQTALAVNYRDLAIEQRRTELKSKPAAAPVQPDDPALAEERDLIFRQLSVISGDEDTLYVIVPGDTLTISYQDRSQTVTNAYKVDGKGEIFMPLIGATKIEGLNRKQAREVLNMQLGEYIRYPNISILINNKGNFMVVGAAGPGVYEITPNLRMMEALLRAGVQEGRANLGNVIVMRGGRDNPVMMRLNLKKMMKKGDREDDILVKPGDLVYVPNTALHNFDMFKNKMFEYLLDYYTLGGATILTPAPTQDNTESN